MLLEDYLYRRSDLSTFVVHLTRDRQNATAKEALDLIVADRELKAGNKQGWALNVGEAGGDSQRVVCFSEVPLEHVHSLTVDLQGQQIKLRPYGVALTKATARRKRINPVWYLDGHNLPHVAGALEDLKESALSEGFQEHPMSKLFPYIERTGPGRQFSWEREWRCVGDVELEPRDVAFWLCPEDEIDQFERDVMRSWKLGGEEGEQRLINQQYAIDPRWGMERIIQHLVRAGDRPDEFDSH